jgi:hypothetical protein
MGREGIMSIYWPLGLFGIAALGGLVMATLVLAGKTPPWMLSVLHALIGASGSLARSSCSKPCAACLLRR